MTRARDRFDDNTEFGISEHAHTLSYARERRA